MKKKLAAMLMGATLVMAACGGGDEAGDSKSAGDPEKLFSQKCSSCHGGNLEGGAGPKLEKIGAKMSQEDIENTIKNGKGSMPPELIEGEDATTVAKWLSEKK
ncbi:cytochrome c551 [Mesobacillus zeae]|uniref:Cytochrome c n=1 Tax=Mesobacillus zeae TaxID=1917180 RepID=A0A398B4P5_9BACI|nr:cytochrome c [Mesobacillus zeae]RID84885.1 cytochrome c [Mesobacillus zeae]